MKKRNIFILMGAMLITFAALILIQERYVRMNVNMLNEQFDKSVKSSLDHVVKDAEENERQIYRDEFSSDPSLPQISTNQLGLKDRQQELLKSIEELVKRDDKDISIRPTNKKRSLDETLRNIQEQKQEDYIRLRTMAQEIWINFIISTQQKEISERIDFEELNSTLEATFHNYGVDLPFHYSIVNKQNKTIYKHNRNVPGKDVVRSDNVYSQQLFPSENSRNPYFLQVIFPTKQSYIAHSLSLFLPSFLIVFLILAIYVVAIVIILRQKHLNVMKSDFINNMTHEFKTPISTISLASQMLQDPNVGKTPETLKHISNVIRDETKRLGFQVEKVLQMAIFERENSTLKLTEIHVNSLIEDVITNFSLKVNSKGGKIISKLKAKDDIALIDELHFTNVIFNLMDNALKYSKETLLLTVETENIKDNITVSIEDNGIGISKEDQKRVFEKFYRVSTGNLHNVKGFGLGLAYVKKIITEHHGTIKVSSELNIGTKFIITIPILKNYEL